MYLVYRLCPVNLNDPAIQEYQECRVYLLYPVSLNDLANQEYQECLVCLLYQGFQVLQVYHLYLANQVYLLYQERLVFRYQANH